MKRCTKCGEVKELTSFHKLKTSKDGHRPDCKECCKRQRDLKNNKDIVMYKAVIMGTGVMQRTKHRINDVKNNCYKENNVKCTLGNTAKEIAEYLYNNFYNEIKSLIDEGKSPSVDRIDSNGDYTEGNIRIIDWNLNVGEGALNASKMASKPVRVIKDGKEEVYESIVEASRQLGIKRDTINRNLDTGKKSRAGFIFESIN